ncbi:MAG: UxaA family hydrolase [Oscillospiraceae bacterium]|nr:UxaA family hydrolase [Oscillospiraceae bacterium]
MSESKIRFGDKPFADGYLRPDGKIGIRNGVLVMYTVNCCATVAWRIGEYFKERGEQVYVIGNENCFDNQVMIKRLLALTVHPNIGAVLVVGHGCEFIQPSKICDFARGRGRRAEWFLDQSYGTTGSINHGIKYVNEMLEELKSVPRAPFGLANLCFGVRSGAMDALSGITSNPAVGAFCDMAVEHGATAMFSQLAEAPGAKDSIVARAANAGVARELVAVYDKCVGFCENQGFYPISQANIKSGITTIEEKGAAVMLISGAKPINGVLKIGGMAKKAGLWYADFLQDDRKDAGFYASGDASELIEFVALGAHLTLFTTGAGHIIGNPIGPTIKITGTKATYKRLSGDIDIDASGVADGTKTLGCVAGEILNYIACVANGEKTKGEQLGHDEGIIFPNYQSARAV